MRCLTLAAQFKKTGIKGIRFLTQKTDLVFLKAIWDSGFEHRKLPPDAGPNLFCQTIRSEALNRLPVCILDSYSITGAFEERLREKGIFVVSMDDMGGRDFRSDVIVNYHLYANRLEYRMLPDTRFLLGPQYAPLRAEFAATRPNERSGPEVKPILITMGGGELGNRVLKMVMETLASIKDRMPCRDITIIAGSHGESIRQLIQMNEALGLGCNLLSNVDNMAERMAESDIGIGAGGVTAYEFAAAGLAAMLFVLGENQAMIAESLEEAEIAINLGWHESVSHAELAERILEIVSDSSKRIKMSRNGTQLIDGNGASRVVEKILELAVDRIRN